MHVLKIFLWIRCKYKGLSSWESYCSPLVCVCSVCVSSFTLWLTLQLTLLYRLLALILSMMYWLHFYIHFRNNVARGISKCWAFPTAGAAVTHWPANLPFMVCAILHFNMSNNSEDRQSCIVSLIVAKEHQKIFNNF